MERRRLINRRESSAGFTLVETLLALAILAFAAGVVVLNAPARRSAAQLDAEKFAARLQFAVEMATLNGEPLRLAITDAEYHYLRFNSGVWEETQLGSLGSGRFSTLASVDQSAGEPALQNDRFLNAVVDEESEEFVIPIDPIGGSMRFSIRFGIDDAFRVSLTETGKVTVGRDEP